MGVVVMSEGLGELVDTSASVERLATGFTFTEGPIWDASQGALLFSDMPGDVRRRWAPGEGVAEVARPSNMGNGMVLDAEGHLLVCEHATSALVRERRGDGRETLATHFEGAELNSPNDVVVRSDGSIWFTDPIYGRIPFVGVEREPELAFRGVFRIPPGAAPGEEPQLVVARDEFDQPNGLCFSPDESLLYVDDSPRGEVKAFDVAPDGTLSQARLFFSGIGSGVVEEGMPDGMKCDERGNVWVTGPGGIWVISPEGEQLGVVEVPEVVGNLAWGGEDLRTLFICASTSLYGIATRVGPAPLPYHGAAG